MSVTVDITERQLTVSVFKLALSLVFIFAFLAIGLALLAGRGQDVAIDALLVCVAFGFLSNGCLAILKIIDWVETRKQRNV